MTDEAILALIAPKIPGDRPEQRAREILADIRKQFTIRPRDQVVPVDDGMVELMIKIMAEHVQPSDREKAARQALIVINAALAREAGQ